MSEEWFFDHSNYGNEDNAVYGQTDGTDRRVVPEGVTLKMYRFGESNNKLNTNNDGLLTFNSGEKYPNYPLQNGSTKTSLSELLKNKSGEYTISIKSIPDIVVNYEDDDNNVGVSDPVWSNYQHMGGRRKKMKARRSLKKSRKSRKWRTKKSRQLRRK